MTRTQPSISAPKIVWTDKATQDRAEQGDQLVSLRLDWKVAVARLEDRN